MEMMAARTSKEKNQNFEAATETSVDEEAGVDEDASEHEEAAEHEDVDMLDNHKEDNRSEHNSQYLDSNDLGSYYSESDKEVADDALRRPSSRVKFDVEAKIPVLKSHL